MRISPLLLNAHKSIGYKKFPSSQFLTPIKCDTVSFSSSKNDINKVVHSEDEFAKFIGGVIDNPKSSKTIAKQMLQKAGSVENFLNQYLAPNGYKDRYSKYIEKAVENAKKPEDLIKISPNWGYWVFEDKFGSDFSIGSVPYDIGTKEDFQTIVKNLLTGDKTKYGVKELQGGMSGKRAFLIDTGENKYVLKTQQDYTLYSDKLRQAVDEDSWLKDTFLKNYKENEQMKSDSSYMNAMIDFYLNLNGCENALKVHYFDAKTGSALYEFAQGETYKGELDIRSINDLMPSLTQLGVIYNDVSPDNLKVHNGEIKIIDSGESNFCDILKPTVSGYQIEMPNWSGNSILSLYGAISLLGNKFSL